MRKGFTIIELMIAISVGMAVFGGVFTTFRQQNIIYLRQESKITLNQDIRIALDIMQRYIRRAGISTANCLGPSCTGIQSGSDSSKLILTSDLNLNGTIETNTLGNSEQYAFIVNSGTLYFCYNATSYVADRCEFLLTNLVDSADPGAFKFEYFSGAVATADLTKVDKVRVTLQTKSQREDTLDGGYIISDIITTDIFVINKTFRTN